MQAIVDSYYPKLMLSSIYKNRNHKRSNTYILRIRSFMIFTV